MAVFGRFALSGVLAVAVNQVGAAPDPSSSDLPGCDADANADGHGCQASEEESSTLLQLRTHSSGWSGWSHWSLFGPSGPKMTDITQGALGDCYFLTTIASIARLYPEVIEKALTQSPTTNSLDRSTFQLRLVVGGEETTVAVDDLIPSRRDTRSGVYDSFERISATGAVWPVLFEKGFAKTMGSYFRTEGGDAPEVIHRISGAPSDTMYPQESSDQAILDFIQESIENNWPMNFGTRSGNTIAAGGHEMTMLESGMREGKAAVHVRNPWHRNEYRGALSGQSQVPGDFWMLLSEFKQIADSLSRGRMVPNGQYRSMRVPVGFRALKFSTKTNKPFALQLTIPSQRALGPGCAMALIQAGNLGLRVAPAHTPKNSTGSTLPQLNGNDPTMLVDMPGGAGEYVAFVVSDFAELLTEVVVGIYGEEAVDDLHVSESMSGDEVVDAMYGGCEEVSVSGSTPNGPTHFKRSQQLVKGSPVWEAVDGSPEKILLKWDPTDHFKLKPALQLTTDNTTFDFALRCTKGEVISEGPSTDAKDVTAAPAASLLAKEAEECDKVELRATLQRRLNLNNIEELRAGFEDSLFPPAEQSIAAKGASCGDTAQGIHVGCSQFNFWRSITAEFGPAKQWAPDPKAPTK